MPLRSISKSRALRKSALVFAFAASFAPPALPQQPAPAASTTAAANLPKTIQDKLDQLQSALKTAQSAGDAKTEAETLNAIGDLYFDGSAFPQAIENYAQALLVARAAQDEPDQAAALNGTGNCYATLSQLDQARKTFQQALDLATAANDVRGQAGALYGMGFTDENRGQVQSALDYGNKALALAHDVNDQKLEGRILVRIGIANWALGKPQLALESFNQSLQASRVFGDRATEARSVGLIGMVYSNLGEKQKALDYYLQALPVLHEVGDRIAEATGLTLVGMLYNSLGEIEKALDTINQALPICREIGSGGCEANALNDIGLIYDGLGDKQKAVDYYSKALPIDRAIGNRIGAATLLNNIGKLQVGLGANQQARDAFLTALKAFHEMGLKDTEATVLNNLGMVYTNLGDRTEAIDYYSQAQTIQQETGDRDGTAKTLNNIGLLYFNLGEKQKALDYFGEALPVATALGDPLLEGLIDYNFMETLKTDRPVLAIYFGKQAFNLSQQVRGNMQGLDKNLQQSFLASISGGYRELAGLLINQGRLPEAQQVLDQLKQQEYTDYVRGDAPNTSSPLALTPAEQQAADDYRKSTEQIIAVGEQWAALKKITNRSPEQEQQYQQLSAQLDASSKSLNDYYGRLYTLFGDSAEANKQVADVKGDVSLLRQAIAKMPHTVALYTLVGSDRYSVIVITGSAAVAREYAIAEKDLNRKVAAFEQVLRDPHSDPKPLAVELYKILIGPAKADLDQAHAQTLVWSLDGVLRYVPVAALYDGKQYVAEKYSTVTITPVSIPHLTEKPDFSNLSAVAMGISRQYESKLPALPAVAGELDDVISDAQDKGAQGVLPGTILLNSAFTEKAMEAALENPHTVVHIASHFVFSPGDDSRSYLLLAGKDQDTAGYHLTVADFRDNQQISLDDTDLLTLSACETGMSGDASNGREVDGLGTTAQLKGAKAVISSLWEVDDASTGALMADFYKRWADGAGKIPKVEALRQAQLDLLDGKVAPQSGTAGRGFSAVDAAPAAQSAPLGYSHPYYWAPFVLMGNWR